MIRSDNHIRTTKLIDDDTDQVFDLCDCIITSRENSTVRGMAGLIYLVMVDVDDIHTLDQSLTFQTLQANDVIVFQRDTGSVCCLENLVPVSGISRVAIRQNTKNAVAALNHLQLLMGEQRGHTELRNGRENGLAASKGHLALHFTLKLFREGCCHLVAERIGNNHKNPVLAVTDLAPIKVHLLRNLQHTAILCQILCAGI